MVLNDPNHKGGVPRVNEENFWSKMTIYGV